MLPHSVWARHPQCWHTSLKHKYAVDWHHYLPIWFYTYIQNQCPRRSCEYCFISNSSSHWSKTANEKSIKGQFCVTLFPLLILCYLGLQRKPIKYAFYSFLRMPQWKQAEIKLYLRFPSLPWHSNFSPKRNLWNASSQLSIHQLKRTLSKLAFWREHEKNWDERIWLSKKKKKNNSEMHSYHLFLKVENSSFNLHFLYFLNKYPRQTST